MKERNKMILKNVQCYVQKSLGFVSGTGPNPLFLVLNSKILINNPSTQLIHPTKKGGGSSIAEPYGSSVAEP
jgi:hypothetical protein